MKKKYNETVFNEYLGECHGHTYYDKDLWRDRGYSVEVMDLYKEGVAYSVKKEVELKNYLMLLIKV